jgi:hypothetical protein
MYTGVLAWAVGSDSQTHSTPRLTVFSSCFAPSLNGPGTIQNDARRSRALSSSQLTRVVRSTSVT